jgi:hypothetical protein
MHVSEGYPPIVTNLRLSVRRRVVYGWRLKSRAAREGDEWPIDERKVSPGAGGGGAGIGRR